MSEWHVPFTSETVRHLSPFYGTTMPIVSRLKGLPPRQQTNTNIILWECLCVILKGFCEPRMVGKERHFQGTAQEKHIFGKTLISELCICNAFVIEGYLEDGTNYPHFTRGGYAHCLLALPPHSPHSTASHSVGSSAPRQTCWTPPLNTSQQCNQFPSRLQNPGFVKPRVFITCHSTPNIGRDKPASSKPSRICTAPFE